MVPFELDRAVGILSSGAAQTLILAVGSVAISSLAAVILALASTSVNGLVSIAAKAFSWVTRGVPPLIILLAGFYGLTSYGLRLEALPAAILALSFSSSAYYMEVIRGGLLGIPNGQYEAARALGLSPWRTTTRIVLPQVVRIVRAPYLATTTYVLKTTAIASVVAVPELLSQANKIVASTGRPFEVLLLATAFYVVLNSVVLAFGSMSGRTAAGMA